MTFAKDERQRTRDALGQYDRAPQCEVCKHSAGFNYYSDDRTANDGSGVVLCERCAVKGSAMPEVNAREFYSG